VFSNNTATTDGGGVLNDGQMTIKGSTFTGNTATFGGGLTNWDDVLTIIDSTFSENSATTEGGGITNLGTMTVINSTISGNAAGATGLGGMLAIGPHATSASDAASARIRRGDRNAYIHLDLRI
jgi:predicted outer membrane repeat protein